MSITQRRLWLAGCDTRILQVDGDGPALIFVHGFADSADTWRPLLDRAARAGRRALAVDLPGFGMAGPSVGPVVNCFTAVVRAAARHALGADSGCVIVGHSMGGLVGLQAGIEDDDGLVAGIVPVASAGLHHPRWIAAAGSAPAGWLARTLPAPLVRAGAVTAIRHLATRRSTPEVQAQVATVAGHFHGRRVARQLTILQALSREIDLPLDLARVACPVLFVWGAHDAAAAFPLNGRRIQKLAAVTPDSRSVVLRRCGHSPQLEVPDELWTHVEGFAAALAPRVQVRQP